MAQRANPDVRREQVADAVIEEIVEHGLRSITLARIAARSGLAIGSIRHYFGDTLREVMRFTLATLMRRVASRDSTFSADPVTRIADAVAFTAPTSDQERKENIALVEYRVMARTDPVLAADIAATSTTSLELLTSALRDAMGHRAIDDADLGRAALLLHAVVEGLSFRSALHSAPLEHEDVHQTITDFLHRLREAHPPA